MIYSSCASCLPVMWTAPTRMARPRGDRVRVEKVTVYKSGKCVAAVGPGVRGCEVTMEERRTGTMLQPVRAEWQYAVPVGCSNTNTQALQIFTRSPRPQIGYSRNRAVASSFGSIHPNSNIVIEYQYRAIVTLLLCSNTIHQCN